MELLRVTNSLPLCAAVYSVRVEADVHGLGSSIEGDFKDDSLHKLYVLAIEDIYPVSTCRIHVKEDGIGTIERVATHPNYQGKSYGKAVIEEAEKWLKEMGVTRVYINARLAVLGFYEKLGYQQVSEEVDGEGVFSCVQTYKDI